MSTQTQVHNGGAVPVVLDDAGRVLEPGQSAPVELSPRVSGLLDAGALVIVDTQATDTDKPARARSKKGDA